MGDLVTLIYSFIASQLLLVIITMLIIIILGVSNIKFGKIFESITIFVKFIFHFFNIKAKFNKYYRKIRLKLNMYRFVHRYEHEFNGDKQIKFIIWDINKISDELYNGDVIKFIFKLESGKVIVNYKNRYNVFDLYEEIDHVEYFEDGECIFIRFLGECLLRFLRESLDINSSLRDFIDKANNLKGKHNESFTYSIGLYMLDKFVVYDHEIEKCFKHHILNRLIFEKPIY